MADVPNGNNTPNNSNTQFITVGQNIVTAINALTGKSTTPVDGLSEAVIDTNSSGTIIAATAGKVIKVFKIWFIVTAPVTITFKDGTTNLDGPMNFSAAGEGFFLDFDLVPWFTCSTASAFNMTLGSGVQVSGRAYYTST